MNCLAIVFLSKNVQPIKQSLSFSETLVATRATQHQARYHQFLQRDAIRCSAAIHNRKWCLASGGIIPLVFNEYL